MTAPLFEAIPNFSEGRDAAKISRIVSSVRAVSGVRVLDLHTDPDHNRSVLTFAGEEEPVLQAAVALAAACAGEIDLSKQTGVHPRMGSLDVLPFVPLENATMDDAIRLAHRAAESIGSLGYPVFLYEHAAASPHRRNLAEVRHGGYEALTERIKDPRWLPDYGPNALDPRLGAVAVGARRFLIAFNAYLDTPDVNVARHIARKVRERDGGLPGLKALGLEVAGRAQVSLNITDVEATPLPVALEAVRESAIAHGARVEWTELVGMMPLEALVQTTQHHLALRDFGPEQVLEAGLWNTGPDATSTEEEQQ